MTCVHARPRRIDHRWNNEMQGRSNEKRLDHMPHAELSHGDLLPTAYPLTSPREPRRSSAHLSPPQRQHEHARSRSRLTG
jgi:hypothetical protein